MGIILTEQQISRQSRIDSIYSELNKLVEQKLQESIKLSKPLLIIIGEQHEDQKALLQGKQHNKNGFIVQYILKAF